jgi:hypothetical protein
MFRGLRLAAAVRTAIGGFEGRTTDVPTAVPSRAKVTIQSQAAGVAAIVKVAAAVGAGGS